MLAYGFTIEHIESPNLAIGFGGDLSNPFRQLSITARIMAKKIQYGKGFESSRISIAGLSRAELSCSLARRTLEFHNGVVRFQPYWSGRTDIFPFPGILGILGIKLTGMELLSDKMA